MAFEIERVSNIPSGLRAAYLASLPEPQELYVETRVARGQKLLVREGRDVVGYAVMHDRTVVEHFMDGADLERSVLALGLVLHGGPADHVLVKSFDVTMLTAALAFAARTQTVGHVFRKYLNQNVVDPEHARLDERAATSSQIEARVAELSDIDAIVAIHDGFFDDVEEIASYITEGGLLLYTSRLGALLGCGIFRAVIPGESDVDIGMVVAPSERGKKLGSYIAGHVMRRCLRRGLRPIAGCAVGNEASRRALVRAGFIETGALIQVSYQVEAK
jgi:GNAT superfamily N-acetyltransferase